MVKIQDKTYIERVREAATNMRFSTGFGLKTLTIVAALSLSGCFAQQIQHGYVIAPEALQQVPVGASQEQVLLALGSPSVVEEFGREGYYYISQTARKRAAFARGRIVDQRVVAVYFDEDGLVSEMGDFGLRDGRVFDFLTRTTPTGGSEITFLQQILRSAASPNGLRGGGR